MSDDLRPPPLNSDIRSLIDTEANKPGAASGQDAGGQDAGGQDAKAPEESEPTDLPRPHRHAGGAAAEAAAETEAELPWAAGAEPLTPARGRTPLRAVRSSDPQGSGQSGSGDSEEPQVDAEEYLTGLIEALLFVSPRPLSLKDLARAAGIDRMRARELVTQLQEERRHRGIAIDEVAEGYLMRSAPRYASEVQALLQLKPVRLSRTQLETLAIVAYRQPVTKPEVDEIRGVDSGQVLKGLLERGLTRMLGKKEEPGRPMLYGTTTHFLELLSLRSLKDLPTLREYTELTEESQGKFRSTLGEEPEVPQAEGAIAESASEGAPSAPAGASTGMSVDAQPKTDPPRAAEESAKERPSDPPPPDGPAAKAGASTQQPDAQQPDAQQPDAQQPDAQQPDAQQPDAQQTRQPRRGSEHPSTGEGSRDSFVPPAPVR